MAKSSLSGLSELGGPEGPCRTPQISADQLTLSQPRGQDYAHHITCGLPPGLSNYILRPCCLSVCPSVIECIQQEQKTFARATPPPLQSRQAQGCRTVWGYGELYPHQVLTEFQSLYPNDSQGFRLCPHQILRPSGGLVTGKLNFINFSVTLGLGFNFRWRSCRRLAAAPKGTSRLDVICSYVLTSAILVCCCRNRDTVCIAVG